jgi:hypothetical protein
MVLWLLLPVEDSFGLLLGATGLHVRHRPHDLSLLVCKLPWAESEVGFARVQKCFLFVAVAIKVRRNGRADGLAPGLVRCHCRRQYGRLDLGRGVLSGLVELREGCEYLLECVLSFYPLGL